MSWYPLLVSLENKNIVIVGGGKIAYRKALSFKNSGATVTVIAPMILDELEALFYVQCKKRSFEKADMENAHIIFAATDDEELNQYIVDSAGEYQWVNNVSDGLTGNFISPATVRRGDLILTVSTSGKSPALAKKIKKQLELQFGEEYGEIVKEYKYKRGK